MRFGAIRGCGRILTTTLLLSCAPGPQVPSTNQTYVPEEAHPESQFVTHYPLTGAYVPTSSTDERPPSDPARQLSSARADPVKPPTAKLVSDIASPPSGFSIARQQPHVFVQTGHEGGGPIAFDPSGRRVVSGGNQDDNVVLWDVGTGREIRKLHADNHVWAISFSPNGRTFLSGDGGGGLVLWNSDTGNRTNSLLGHEETVSAVEFSADGALALSGDSKGTMILWDVSRGKEVRRFREGSSDIVAISFGPSGRYAVSVDKDTAISMWDIEHGTKTHSFKAFDIANRSGFTTCADLDSTASVALIGTSSGSVYELAAWDVNHGKRINSLSEWEDKRPTRRMGDFDKSRFYFSCALTHDGKYAVAGTGDGGTLTMWETQSGRELWKIQAPEGVYAIAFSPDDKHLVTRSGKTLSMRDLQTGREVRQLAGGALPMSPVSSSKDGRIVFSSRDGVLRAWDLFEGHPIWEAETGKDRIGSIAVSSDGRRVVVATGNRYVSEYDGDTGRFIRKMYADVSPPRRLFSESFPFAISEVNDETLLFWMSGLPSHMFRRLESSNTYASLTDPAITMEGDIESEIVFHNSLFDKSLSEDMALERFAMASLIGKDLVLKPPGREIDTVAVSSDGRYALGAGTSGSVTLWNLDNGVVERNFVGHMSRVTTVAFGRGDSIAVSGGDDGLVKVWDLATGSEVRSFARFGGADENPTLGAYMAVLAYYFGDERTLEDDLPKAVSLAVAMRLSGLGRVNQAIIHPDGDRVVSGGGFFTVEAYNIADGNRILALEGVTKNVLSSLRLNNRGTQLLSGDRGGLIKLWDFMPPRKSYDFGFLDKSKEIWRAEAGVGSVSSVEFLRNDELVFGSGGQGAGLWDVSSGAAVARIYAFPEGEWVVITPEGFFNSSPNGAKYLNVRFGNRVYAIDQFYNALYRPDLVHAKLQGDPDGLVAQAASRLNLAKLLEGGAPPLVALVSPVEGAAGKRDIEAVVEITDQGGGIGKVEWRLNGTTVGVEEPGRGITQVKKAPADGQRMRLKKLLTLTPGSNQIEVIAYNAAGGVASDPGQVDVELMDAISEPPALHILAVGINRYRDKSLWLNYAVPDGKGLMEGLRSAGKTIFTAVDVTEVYDQDATLAGISAAFDRIAAQAKSNDVFVFYLAGHGITLDGRYYFLPVDFRYHNEESVREAAINQDNIQEWMSRVPAQKSLVLLDTCNSGSYVEAQAAARGIAEKTAIDKLTRATGRATIAASSDTQVALEGYEGHGVFTYALLQALAKADARNGNRDGVTSTAEIASYVNEQVPDITYKKWGYEQVPQVNLHGREFPVGVAR